MVDLAAGPERAAEEPGDPLSLQLGLIRFPLVKFKWLRRGDEILDLAHVHLHAWAHSR